MSLELMFGSTDDIFGDDGGYYEKVKLTNGKVFANGKPHENWVNCKKDWKVFIQSRSERMLKRHRSELKKENGKIYFNGDEKNYKYIYYANGEFFCKDETQKDHIRTNSKNVYETLQEWEKESKKESWETARLIAFWLGVPLALVSLPVMCGCKIPDQTINKNEPAKIHTLDRTKFDNKLLKNTFSLEASIDK